MFGLVYLWLLVIHPATNQRLAAAAAATIYSRCQGTACYRERAVACCHCATTSQRINASSVSISETPCETTQPSVCMASS